MFNIDEAESFAPDGGDGSDPLHAVLHVALASGDCPPPVASLIVEWARRDPIDAMVDARLLLRALKKDDGVDLDRKDVSKAARRAYADWTRDYSEAEAVANADRLAGVLTDWADAVLDEAIIDLREISGQRFGRVVASAGKRI